MNENHRPYNSYLLRLWQAPGELRRIWRASLEDPQTGKRQSFATIQALCAFLQESTHQPDSHAAQEETNDC